MSTNNDNAGWYVALGIVLCGISAIGVCGGVAYLVHLYLTPLLGH